MGNQLLTRQEITFESLDVLKNNLKIVPNVYRDLDQEFGKKGGKIGDTIYVRKPPRFVGADGAAYQPEGLTDTEVPVSINQQSQVSFEFNSQELYLSIDDWRRRYLENAGTALANKLDYRTGQTMMQNTANFVGTVGTTPGLGGTDAYTIYLQAGQKLDEMGFSRTDKKTLVFTSAANTGYIAFGKAFFNPQDSVSKEHTSGTVVNAFNYNMFIDENIPAQIIGLLGGTPAVSGAGQTGTSLLISGGSASIVGWANVGDVFTISGVFATNPQSRASTGSLQQFTVQANANTAGDGSATLTFVPAIVPSGQFQNVTNAPANGSLLSVYGANAAGQSALSGVTFRNGLLFHKQAAAFVSFPGAVANDVDMGFAESDPDTGVSLRYVRWFDGVRDIWPSRLDVYYGIAPLYNEGATRIAVS
jgi:hypothetical protein